MLTWRCWRAAGRHSVGGRRTATGCHPWQTVATAAVVAARQHTSGGQGQHRQGMASRAPRWLGRRRAGRACGLVLQRWCALQQRVGGRLGGWTRIFLFAGLCSARYSVASWVRQKPLAPVQHHTSGVTGWGTMEALQSPAGCQPFGRHCVFVQLTCPSAGNAWCHAREANRNRPEHACTPSM